MDPAQTLSTQYLTYTNNIKEKLAVIIAYFHLNFGMFVNAMNCVHFGKFQKLFFDIFTGFWIFLGLIGFMIVLIYVKWWCPVYAYDFAADNPSDTFNISTSPSIISVVIGDVMGIVNFAPKVEILYFDSQQKISDILVYITFICLPIMLCAIPCIAICCGAGKHHDDVPDEFSAVAAHNAGEEEEAQLVGGDDDMKDDIRNVEEMLKAHSPQDEGSHNVGEIFIHQIIETIEFVLGCISNTASYLRLWALSLAHGQLGEVFLQIFFTQWQGFAPVSEMSPVAATIIFFLVGFGYMFTILCVLLMMDCLEVFLHTMRLHWVEFMGKFYEGLGVPYKPFSFKAVFDEQRSRKDVTN